MSNIINKYKITYQEPSSELYLQKSNLIRVKFFKFHGYFFIHFQCYNSQLIKKNRNINQNPLKYNVTEKCTFECVELLTLSQVFRVTNVEF